MTRQLGSRPLGDRAFVGGVEVLAFGFLVLVSGVLLVVNAWAVVDAKLAVDGASREAVRAHVEAPNADAAAAAAQARAHDTLAGFGRDGGRATVGAPVLDDGGFGRCARVTITVEYLVPAITVPWIGGFGRGIRASASHSELIDPYRDGLDGAGC